MLTERRSSAVLVTEDCASTLEKKRKSRRSVQSAEIKRDIRVSINLQKNSRPFAGSPRAPE
jgi:hypothetical protein